MVSSVTTVIDRLFQRGYAPLKKCISKPVPYQIEFLFIYEQNFKQAVYTKRILFNKCLNYRSVGMSLTGVTVLCGAKHINLSTGSK